MELQEIFDKAVGGVLQLAGLARKDDDKCVYRGERDDGKTIACGIGQLIPDNVYDTVLEDIPVNALLERAQDDAGWRRAAEHFTDVVAPAVGLDLGDAKTRELLNRIQLAHDDSHDIDEFRTRARNAARQMGLSTEIVEADHA